MTLEILHKGDKQEIRALFAFDKSASEKEVLLKFKIWGRWLYPKFFSAADAPFHGEMDKRNLRIYRGVDNTFIDIAFRGAAKTTRTKLFVAFCIANDMEHFRRYIKVLSADGDNSKQIVTDVYNLLINRAVVFYYPEIFVKTPEKREETMSSFTTATGVKMQSDTVGTDQRGDIQDDARPDFIWCDDFETRKTLRSAVVTQAIWENMEEARNGLSKNGGMLYNCNYLSERGNVHRLVVKHADAVLITPIKGKIVNGMHVDGPPTWAAYTAEEVETKLRNADDAAGEYLCVPSAGTGVFIDRGAINKQVAVEPIRTISDFKMFYAYDPSHRYGAGQDVAGGVGLDSSTNVVIDFSTTPSRVVATFKSNALKPSVFGDQIKSDLDRYGACIAAPENNKYDMVIGRLRQIYENIYFTETDETRVGMPPKIRTYGWNTNADSKPKMFFDLLKAVVDGHLDLSDKDLIAEGRSYTTDDLMDKEVDPRLTTRHFDLLTAAAIAWQMRNFAVVAKEAGPGYVQEPYQRSGLDE